MSRAPELPERLAGIGGLFRSVVAMNEPDHCKYRMLTQEYFGSKDTDLNRDKEALSPEANFQSVRRVIEDATAYFGRISEARRRNPTDDLASAIANAVVDGKPISDVDAMGYYITVTNFVGGPKSVPIRFSV